MNRLQPALLGGAFFGILSALPLISVGNCCCLWVLGGGLIAAYLLQANTPQPITAGDGAVVGLLAGIIGAVIYTLVAIPVTLLTGPFQRAMIERVLESSEFTGPWRDVIEGIPAGGELGAFALALGFLWHLCLGAVFSTLGGLLGAVLFQKKA